MEPIANKYLSNVNISGVSRKKRSRFAHFVWLLLIIAAACMAWLRGMGGGFVMASVLAACVPGLIGAFFIDVKRESGAGRGLLVLAWTLLATLAMALTGGAGSPLIIMYAIAPVAAFALGERRLAIEAAVFSILAFVAAVMMEIFGMMPPPLVALMPFATLLALASLIMLGFLVWAALGNAKAEAARLAALQAQIAASTAAPAEQTPAERLIVGLPEGSGSLLLDITPEGRLRGASGDTLGLGLPKVGQPLRELLGEGGAEALKPLLKKAGIADIGLSSGLTARAVSEVHESGARLMLSDVSANDTIQTEAAAAVEKAQADMKGQTAFFAGLGHDLKTPLNAIMGYADMMRAEIRGPLSDDYKDYSNIIHESGQDLLLLVDDILDLSKAQAGRHRMEVEPVDLSASCQSVMRQLENQAERVGVKLKLKAKGEVWAEADARAVRQIWQNLLSNAIKYSKTGQTVTLDAREDGNVTILSVADKGAGMDEADLARIAQPFAQGMNARGRAGTGLGLAVVQRFAELHGGQVKIETAPNKGTTVEVTLPRADMTEIELFEDAAE